MKLILKLPDVIFAKDQIFQKVERRPFILRMNPFQSFRKIRLYAGHGFIKQGQLVLNLSGYGGHRMAGDDCNFLKSPDFLRLWFSAR